MFYAFLRDKFVDFLFKRSGKFGPRSGSFFYLPCKIITSNLFQPIVALHEMEVPWKFLITNWMSTTLSLAKSCQIQTVVRHLLFKIFVRTYQILTVQLAVMQPLVTVTANVHGTLIWIRNRVKPRISYRPFQKAVLHLKYFGLGKSIKDWCYYIWMCCQKCMHKR